MMKILAALITTAMGHPAKVGGKLTIVQSVLTIYDEWMRNIDF